MDAVSVLRSGGVIAYPTETVYGLGCDPRNQKAVDQLFRMKRREKGKPILLVASSMAQVGKVATVSASIKRFLKTVWPGALTVVLPLRPEIVLAKGISLNGEVAIRISSSSVVRALARGFGFPVTSTSANLSGAEPCRSAKEVVEIFSSHTYRPDMMLDGGRLPKRKASTIIRFLPGGKVEILRQGSVRIPRNMLK